MNWNDWDGKNIFVQLKTGAVYTGVVKEVADIGDGIIFISIIDKFGAWVTFTVSEIIKIKEELGDGKRDK